jgi:MFS family permease
MLAAGLALFAVASAACAVAPTVPALVAARAAQGLGAALMTSLAMAFVAGTVPREQTGRAMGLLGTMSAIGTALGPSLGGLLAHALGWPAIFWLNVPLGLAAAGLALRVLPDDPAAPRPRPRFDTAGAALLAATLTAYALAATAGTGLTVAGLLLVAAAMGTLLFLRVEARAAAPLIEPGMLGRSPLAGALALNGVVSTVMMATLVVGPFYLSRGLGLDVAAVGGIMAVGPAMAALTGVVAGRVVDRIGASNAVAGGLAVVTGGAAALALAPTIFGWVGYVGALAVLTPGYQLFQAGNTTAVMVDVEPGRRGVVSGILNLSRNLGLITGAAAMGALFAVAAGTADVAAASPDEVGRAMQATFLVAAALAGVAALAAAAGREGRA